jgi:hypothetical protein
MGGIALCAICGDQKSSRELWFLVAENRWEDKLKILQWNDRLAGQRGVMRACGAAHVQELVVHWMTTGRLDYPFARSTAWRGIRHRYSRTRLAEDEVDTDGVRQIGEIAVDRESMARVLTESPSSLQGILDALVAALHRESMHTDATAESDHQQQVALAGQI